MVTESPGTAAIEAGAVYAMCDTDSMALALLRGLMPDDFALETARKAFAWSTGYYREYGVAPSRQLLDQQFDKLAQFAPPNGVPEFFFDSVKEKAAGRAIESVVEHEIQSSLYVDPLGFADTLIYELGQIRARGSKFLYGHGTDDDALSRLAAFDARREAMKKNLGVIGLRTGIATIDGSGLGFVDGDLISIIARPYIGKTWMLTKFGVEAWNQGKNILFISSEMQASWMELRIDTLLAQRLGFHLSYNDLMKAAGSREEYEKYLTSIEGKKRWFTYDSYQGERFTPEKIIALAQLHHADVVLVDGVYNVASEGRGDIDYSVVGTTCQKLKHLAVQNRCVVAITTQANRSAGDLDRPPRMDQVAYSDAIIQHSDIIMTMCLDSTNKTHRVLDRMKWRNMGQESFTPIDILFDPDRGLIIDALQSTDEMEAAAQALEAATA